MYSGRKEQLPIILVVDTREDVRGAIERELMDLAIVVQADIADRALEIASQVRLDLVITEHRPPVLDGLVLLARLALVDRESRRVLIAAEDVEGVDREQSRDVVHAVLTRPWSSVILRQVISALLARPPRPPRIAPERRRARRVATTLEVLYTSRGRSNYCSGASVDVSRDGARIRAEAAPVTVGDLVEVHMRPLAPEGPASGIMGIAQVVWARGSGVDREFGLRFLEFREPESRRRLAVWTGDTAAISG